MACCRCIPITLGVMKPGELFEDYDTLWILPFTPNVILFRDFSRVLATPTEILFRKYGRVTETQQ